MARTQRPHRRVAVSAAARSVAADSGLGYVAGHGAQTRVRSLPLRALALLEGVRHRGRRRPAGPPDQRHDFMLGINEPPKQASAVGGIRRWKDGRNMPDVHAVVYDYDGLPVYMRLNLGTEMPEMYRIQGSKGLLEVTGSSLSYTPQSGKDQYPSCYTGSYPCALRDAYLTKWHQDNDPKIGQQVMMPETISFSGPDFDDVRPHLWTYFEAVRT